VSDVLQEAYNQGWVEATECAIRDGAQRDRQQWEAGRATGNKQGFLSGMKEAARICHTLNWGGTPHPEYMRDYIKRQILKLLPPALEPIGFGPGSPTSNAKRFS